MNNISENTMTMYYNNKPKVCILREEGSNGNKEMVAVFKYVGFECYDILTSELANNLDILDNVRGIVYVGGFSNRDVLGAAQGWYLTIKNNIQLYNKLKDFYRRPDIFSLGVCNGCQLMAKLNIITSNNIKLVKNKSNKFESRFTNVKIIDDSSIFFKNMKNMNFGIWLAHGEGQFINTHYLTKKQKPCVYTYNDNATDKYPFNPNGSENGLAAIVSENGKHLAMMPHPERCFLKWQLPYKSKYDNINCSPWLMMFKNIYDWCKI